MWQREGRQSSHSAQKPLRHLANSNALPLRAKVCPHVVAAVCFDSVVGRELKGSSELIHGEPAQVNEGYKVLIHFV